MVFSIYVCMYDISKIKYVDKYVCMHLGYIDRYLCMYVCNYGVVYVTSVYVCMDILYLHIVVVCLVTADNTKPNELQPCVWRSVYKLFYIPTSSHNLHNHLMYTHTYI